MRRNERGVVLLMVLVFALLLIASVTTFLRKSTMDTFIVRNREARAQAEALARGGIRVATALILADTIKKTENPDTGGAPSPEPLSINSEQSSWAQLSDRTMRLAGGATLRVHIEDAGAKLNLNAIVRPDADGELASQAQPLLEAMFEKVIDEMPVPAEQKVYDVRALAEHLIDYVDADDVSLSGGSEDDYYQQQDPPYRAANRPLLSVDELRRVEGFDDQLVEALRPYVTVFPYAGSGGINPNTAPPHVLSLLFFDDGVDLRLAEESTVRQILETRQEGGTLCDENQSDERCTPIREIVTNAIYPPPQVSSDVFTVTAKATVRDVDRSIEAVILRGQDGQTQLLSWRIF